MQPVNNTDFFKFIFGDLDGYLCIVTIDRKKGKKVDQHFYQYPQELDAAVALIDKMKMKVDCYFAPFLLTRERRRKQDIAETPVAWADGDDCPIESLQLQPSAVIKTSEGRHSFFWKFDDAEPPETGEDISKRIAYYHADEGMDKSGWDLTQLLRVPDSWNHKYTPPQAIPNAVVAFDVTYSPQDFSDYPDVENTLKLQPLKEAELPDKDAKAILAEYRSIINPRAFDLFEETPRGDWSKRLWELELILFEAGMSLGEAFVVANESACNKYKRDKRPAGFLFKEVQRAARHVEDRRTAPPEFPDDQYVIEMKAPELLSEDERKAVRGDITFVEEYTQWASTLGDAAIQYHPAGAFVILSTLLSGSIKLPTSFGTVLPNLWFMILADTTLTRKSTAMDIATDLLYEVDADSLLATDGSIEGLLTAMGTRPGRPSLFLRDEVTGLIDAITKKDYLAGMMETLTKLYDGKNMKRLLRKETIDVRDPILILFSGGIRNKMVEILDYKHVSSGFLPRFIFITAESDITRLKPIGPPTEQNTKERNRLLHKMVTIKKHYAPTANQPGTVNQGRKLVMPKHWNAELTPDAWQMYNGYEVKMVQFAIDSHDPTLLTPMMDRLAKSGLKVAVLLAASRMNGDKVVVTELDMLHAFWYVEQWMEHTVYMIKNLGTSQDEKKMQKVLSQIEANPGILRSRVMQRNFLTAREADNMFATLEQRNAIRREGKSGRGERLYPSGV